ncbi:pentapeptide repeat-containing protein [Streptomyces naphthomycinicus]|uniref:pentapeptide repeat-containing protein n=1 Tax=Streptomyces naphthomycinicus TaxID=2872625 RepID=UPI001CECC946|nr:pentapeptide repeat-containing protein [Streptomyces sp. TML10]
MGSVRRGRIAAFGLTAISVGLLVVALFPWDRLTRFITQIPLVPLTFVGASVACAVAAVEVYRRARPQQPPGFVPPIRWWWVLLASVAVLAAVWATTGLLLTQIAATQPESERAKQQIEAVRTGLAAGGGVGAAITVLLAFRRQHHHEQATKRTEHDADERRITELYTRAVEQLGNDKAPVRLGGLYALERLGQAVPVHRQTIVDVICAYLRMPYTPHAVEPLADSPPEKRTQWRRAASRTQRAARAMIRGKEHNQRRQELQVRVTAQRILAAHLRDRRASDELETAPADPLFWDGMGIDLTHANLIGLDFMYCHVTRADFAYATFTSSAFFSHAHFAGTASFAQARFADHASFESAHFADDADFSDARFADTAVFRKADFDKRASFDEARFLGDSNFRRATFGGGVSFKQARFLGDTSFDTATFSRAISFDDVTFIGATRFSDARVTDVVTLQGAPAVERFWPSGWDLHPTTSEGVWVLRPHQRRSEP